MASAFHDVYDLSVAVLQLAAEKSLKVVAPYVPSRANLPDAVELYRVTKALVIGSTLAVADTLGNPEVWMSLESRIGKARYAVHAVTDTLAFAVEMLQGERR